jgi:hypothetical protein
MSIVNSSNIVNSFYVDVMAALGLKKIPSILPQTDLARQVNSKDGRLFYYIYSAIHLFRFSHGR